MIIPFHVVIREKNTVLKKLKWYKWLIKPDFYLVSAVLFVPLLIFFIIWLVASPVHDYAIGGGRKLDFTRAQGPRPLN